MAVQREPEALRYELPVHSTQAPVSLGSPLYLRMVEMESLTAQPRAAIRVSWATAAVWGQYVAREWGG